MRTILLSFVLGIVFFAPEKPVLVQYKSTTISVPVRDLEAAKTWVETVFGKMETMEPAAGYFEFMLNDQTWLQLFEQSSNGSKTVIRLEVEDIEKEHQKLKDLGIKTGVIILVPEVVLAFEFEDPDGNQYSFYELIE